MNILDTIRKRSENNGIKLPVGITFELQNQTLFITVSSKGVVANMQNDNSAFEGWSVCLKALLPDIIQNIVLDWVLPSPNSNQTEMIHYNRFLFRAILFDKYFDWVSIASSRKDELSAFEKVHTNLVVNYPKSDSKQQVAQNGTINKGEAILERIICSNMQERGLIANHQLPVGLFDSHIHKNNTCTPRSASQIDLWALSDDALNVYELKDEENNSVGIITELMFYANVMNMIRERKINYPDEVAKLRNSKRNIQDLYQAITQNQVLRVNAILLTYKLHPLIDCNKDKVLKLINRSMEPVGISFSHELVQDYL